VKRSLLFALACAATIGALWGILVLLFTEAAVRRALGITATIAFFVQVVAFLVARMMAQRKNVMAGWGIGVVLRFVVLAVFALVVVPRLGLPLASSLLGLAMFLFVTTLIEPLFLKQQA
jgi:hypothetical protein